MPVDYSKYCKDWKIRSKFIRFYRAKNKCEVCGAENYKPHPMTGSKVILTVAHLDHDITNNSFFNLKAMCQRCHLRYDAKHHAETRRKKRIDMETYNTKLISADFEESTMEFEIQHEFTVKAGDYVILHKADYEKLMSGVESENGKLLKPHVSGSATDLYTDLMKLINAYCKQG